MTRPAPMADGTLAALAKRVEAEPASADLWLNCCLAVFPEKRDPVTHFQQPDATVDLPFTRFALLHRIGAYLDAADMLRPSTHRFVRIAHHGDHVHCLLDAEEGETIEGLAYDGEHMEARARLAAALRARDAGGA